MRELSDEEKGRLQAKINEARTGGTQRAEKEVGKPRTWTLLLLVGVLALLITLLQYATGLEIPLRVKRGIWLLLMVAVAIRYIGRRGKVRKDRDE